MTDVLREYAAELARCYDGAFTPSETIFSCDDDDDDVIDVKPSYVDLVFTDRPLHGLRLKQDYVIVLQGKEELGPFCSREYTAAVTSCAWPCESDCHFMSFLCQLLHKMEQYELI